MTNADYIKRLDEANGDPRRMFEAHGEYVAELLLTYQTEVRMLAGEVKRLAERLSALEAGK